MNPVEKSNLSAKNELLNGNLYKLVSFVGSEDENGKKDIDIVLSSWMRYSENENKYFTRFPSPPYDYSTMGKLNAMLKKGTLAPSKWREYEVKIEGQSKTFRGAKVCFEKVKRKNNPKKVDQKKRKISLPLVLVKKLDMSAFTPPSSQVDFNSLDDSEFDLEINPEESNLQEQEKEAPENFPPEQLKASDVVSVEKMTLRKRKINDDQPRTSSSETPSKIQKVVAPPEDDSNAIPGGSENFETYSEISSLQAEEQREEEEEATNPIGNGKNNMRRPEITHNFLDVFSQIVTEQERDDPQLLFPRIMKALYVIYVNQLESQRTLRDITMSLTSNTDLAQVILQKFNFLLPISSMDDFIIIDQTLASNPPFRSDFKLILNNFLDENSIEETITNILKACLARDVVTQFTTGETGKAPIILKDTEFFKIMLEFITEEFEKRSIQVTKEEFLDKIETVLSNNVD